MNTTKYLFSLTALFMLLSLSTQAQDMDDFSNFEGREKIQAARVAYITKRLNLSPEESQRFWAVHNEYEAEKRSLKVQQDRNPSLEALSDPEVEQMIENRFQIQQQLLDLDRAYYQKFKQVIPARKVALFYKADKEFRLELLKRIRQERQERARPGQQRRFGN